MASDVNKKEHQDKKSMLCLLDLIHGTLSNWRSLKRESIWLQKSLHKADELISQAKQQIELYNRAFHSIKNFNDRCLTIIQESNRIKCELFVKLNDLELARMDMNAEQSCLTNELLKQNESVKNIRNWIGCINSQLEQELIKSTETEIVLHDHNNILASYESHNKLLAEQIEDKSDLLKSRTLMLCCQLVDVELKIIDVNKQANVYEEACVKLERKNERLERISEERAKLIKKIREMRLAKRFSIYNCLAYITNGIMGCIRWLSLCPRSMYDTSNVAIESLGFSSSPPTRHIGANSIGAALAYM